MNAKQLAAVLHTRLMQANDILRGIEMRGGPTTRREWRADNVVTFSRKFNAIPEANVFIVVRRGQSVMDAVIKHFAPVYHRAGGPLLKKSPEVAEALKDVTYTMQSFWARESEEQKGWIHVNHKSGGISRSVEDTILLGFDEPNPNPKYK